MANYSSWKDAAGAVLSELGAIEKRTRGAERSLSKVNVAAKALRVELVTLGILGEDDEHPRARSE